MRFIRSFLLISFFGAFFVSCRTYVYKAVWQSPPVKADGIPSEWSGRLRMYDNASDMYFAISNDLDNLYIRVKTKNKQTQMQILRYGLQVWIDTSGRNKEVTGFQFPFYQHSRKSQEAGEGADSIGSYNRGGRPQTYKHSKEPDFETLRNKFNSNDKWINLTGFKPPVSGIVSVYNDFGIGVNIGWDAADTLYYEASIPFRTFYRSGLHPADSSTHFGIQLTTKGLPSSQSFAGDPGYGYGSGMSAGMGGFGMGMGGFGGMGMAGMGFGLRIPLGGGGGYPGGGYGSYNGANGAAIKLKMKLAVKPDIQPASR
jgi:hypothetical protein